MDGKTRRRLAAVGAFALATLGGASGVGVQTAHAQPVTITVHVMFLTCTAQQNHALPAIVQVAGYPSGVFTEWRGTLNSSGATNFTATVEDTDGGVRVWGKVHNCISTGINYVGINNGETSFGNSRVNLGDANDDNLFNATDFNILNAAYGSACGDAGYDERADFNKDCLVDATDWNALRASYGLAGSAPIQPYVW